MHRADARVKLVLLLVFTVCLFVACTWRALLLLSVFLAATLALSRLPVGTLMRMLVPLYALMAFAVAFNTLTFNPEAMAAYGMGSASAGVFASVPAVSLTGGLYLLPAGLMRSLFYCVRVTAMVLASLLVAYSTPATQLTAALAWFLRPLARFRAPVDDIAFTFTLALRFIPLAFEELQQVKLAQMARGANFGKGGLWRRLKAWQPVMVPWLVGLYRRAGRMAIAMDARAYGTTPGLARSSLRPLHARKADLALLAAGLAASVLPCLVFAG